MAKSPNISAEDAREHAELVIRLARALVRDPDEASDLSQSAWEVAIDGADQRHGSLGGWLTGVVRNLAKMRARGAFRRTRHEAETGDLHAEPVPTPEALTAQLQAQKLVIERVLALAEDAREVLVLRFYEGMSAADISRHLGVPAGTVRWRLKCALDELRERLNGDLGGE